jgi:hypothetical protein
MGGQKFNPGTYANFQQSTRGKTTHQVFAQAGLHKDLNPHGVRWRESRDSTVNPLSTPIIVGLDVTGSMGFIADEIARQGLGTLFKDIYDKKPVTDPHIMFMGIGDVRTDRAPLQVSQFEAGPQIIEQLTNIYLEGNGGGNHGESYQLPWYFAALHTVHDAWEKRQKKGYLFTIGDEPAPVTLTREQIEVVTGDTPERDLEPELLLQLAQKTYKVFHLVVEEGGYASYDSHKVYDSWRRLLGENVIPLKDYKTLAEVIIGTIGASEGHDISNYFTGMTAKVVQEAVKQIPRGL